MKKDWRIKKAKNGPYKYEYKEVYLKEAYARYKKKYREEIKKGNAYAKLTRKEYDELMNQKLNNPTNRHYHGDKDSFATQIIKESKTLKKKSFNKIKELGKQYGVNIHQNMDRWELHNSITELVSSGAFGNQDVDDFLY